MHETVHMPGTILVMLRHKQHIKLAAISLALIPDPLHEALVISFDIEAAAEFLLIQCSGEEVVPLVAQAVLQHHGASTGEAAAQLLLVVLMLFRREQPRIR